MKTPFKNIEHVFRLNGLIVWAMVITCGLVCVISVTLMAKAQREVLNGAFVVNGEGEVIPLTWVDQRKNREVEALAHLEQFHQWFYGVDAGSYERNMERALWLGNSSVTALYQQKKADGFYNRLLQYSLVQKVIQVDSRVTLEKEAFRFETRTLIEIHRGTITDTYELLTTGRLIHVDRHFPHNPHGLLIAEFFEKSLRKIEEHEATEK